MKGLEIGWQLQRDKKLPPKPCLVCGGNVFYTNSTKDRAKYCSLQCKYEGSRGRKYQTTKQKTGETIICKTCGKNSYRTLSEIKRGRTNYCSFECRKKGGYNPYRKGQESPNWKGGTSKVKGYIYVKCLEHPNKNSGGYVAQHRLVMEKHIGRYLFKKESVHHKNGVKDDNRIENLELVSCSPHNGYVECPHCKERFLIR